MKPLRIALIHYDTSRQFDRMTGFWAYEVPEFEFAHFGVSEHAELRRSQFARDFDIIVREDHRNYGRVVNDAPIPLAYYVVDSTASEGHYQTRCTHAARADLILVEHDRLKRFEHLGPPVRRFGYCVNDRLFHDYGLEKTVDVGMYANPTPARDRLMAWLRDFCERQGYTFDGGRRADRLVYAHGFNQTRLSINLSQTPTNRPHRVFDAMACRTCLVTSRLPKVSGEAREAGEHYVEFDLYGWADDLGGIVDGLLATGGWRGIADAAHDLVHERHTWAVRAGELRQTFFEEFGL